LPYAEKVFTMVYTSDGKYDEEKLREDFDKFNNKHKEEFQKNNGWYADEEDFM
jgi:hypothetical protein